MSLAVEKLNFVFFLRRHDLNGCRSFNKSIDTHSIHLESGDGYSFLYPW